MLVSEGPDTGVTSPGILSYERKENKVIAVIHTDTEIAAILARKGWPIVSDR